VALFFALAGTAAALPGKNSVDSGDVENGEIRSRDVQDQGILGKDVANEGIGALQIDDGSLGGADISNDGLTGADVADRSLTGADVDSGALTGEDISDESLGGGDVANGGLTGADLSDESITGADVTNGGLTGADVSDEALTGADIAESSLQGLQAAPAVSSTSASANQPAAATCGSGNGGLDGLGPSVNVNVSSNRLVAVYVEATMFATGGGEAQVWIAEGGNCRTKVLGTASGSPVTRHSVPGDTAGSGASGGWVLLRTTAAGPQNIGLRYENSGSGATFDDRFIAVVPY
jgi:hypothetical protein